MKVSWYEACVVGACQKSEYHSHNRRDKAVIHKTYSLPASIVSYYQQEQCNTQGIPVTQHLHSVINLLTC